MRAITVLYDADCALCRRLRAWLEPQPKYVAMRFVAAGSTQARELFPALDAGEALERLTVVGDDGAVYSGDRAWLICLWCLRSHRAIADRLASPLLRPMARTILETVSRNRREISRMMEPSKPERAET